MQNVKISKQNLEKWADNLYAIGKGLGTLSDRRLPKDTLNIAREIYTVIHPQSKAEIDVSVNTLISWRNEIQRLRERLSGALVKGEILSELLHIDQDIQEHLKRKPMVDLPSHGTWLTSELLWTSIVLSFTLWYGGQSFSLSTKEFDVELGLHQNPQIRHALKTLHSRSILLERKSGLIVINPRSKKDVDMATLFLIALGTSLTLRLNSRRGYLTLQAGFLEFSRAHHHPMAELAGNVRSYISDYCQRIFGELFTRLQEEGSQPDYSLLRRFVTRLSLYCSSDFVISKEHDVSMLVGELKRLGLIVLVPGRTNEEFILLKKEVMKD